MKRDTYFHACEKIDGCLYVNTFLESAMMKMDLATGQMHFINGPSIYSFKDYYWQGGMNISRWNNTVIQVENSLKTIACYSIRDDRTEYIRLNGKAFSASVPNYSLMTIWKDMMFVFPRFSKHVVCFNLKTHKMVKKEISLILGYEFIDDMYVLEKALFSCAVQVKNDVWLFSGAESIVVRYSLDTSEQKIYRLPLVISSCKDIVYEDGVFYIFDSFGGNVLYCWNQNTNSMEIICKLGGNKDYFSRIAVTKKNVWFLPNRGEDILVYRIDVKTLEIYQNYPQDFQYDEFVIGQAHYFGRSEDDEWYYFAMCAETHMLMIHKITGQAHWLKPLAPSYEERFSIVGRHNGYMIQESDNFSIQDFIRLSRVNKRVSQGKFNSGKQIWKVMRGLNDEDL